MRNIPVYDLKISFPWLGLDKYSWREDSSNKDKGQLNNTQQQ